MPDITLKAIDQLLDKKLKVVATTKDLDSLKRDLTEELRATERRMIKHADDLQAELARMVESGFTDVQQRLDVRQQVQRHQMALHEIYQKLGLHFEI
jgi:phosphoenolpyruvate carboxylase